MTQVIAFYRVSSEEQEKAGYSLDGQQRDCESYAATNGYRIVEAVRFAESAKQTGRKAVEAVYEALARRPGVRHVLVHRLDRWSRNLTDYAQLQEQRGVTLVSVREGFTGGTPQGDFMQGMMVLQARLENDTKAERVVEGMHGKVLQGRYPGKAPVGYVNVPRTKTREARIDIDPNTAGIVRAAFETYAAGLCALNDIASDLYDDGVRTRTGRPFSAQMVRRLLTNPFYVGRIRYKGEQYDGAHDALVDLHLWEEVQATINRRRRRDFVSRTKMQFLLRGLVYCGTCGRRWTAERHPRGSYYRCPVGAHDRGCREPYFPVEQLDLHVEPLLQATNIDAKKREELIHALEHLARTHATSKAKRERTLERRMDHLRAKRMKLLDRFADRMMDDDELKTLLDRYKDELQSLERRRRDLDSDVPEKALAIRDAVRNLGSVSWLYENCADQADRKTLLARIFKRIVVSERAVVRVEYQPPFNLLTDEHATGSMAELEASVVNVDLG